MKRKNLGSIELNYKPKEKKTFSIQMFYDVIFWIFGVLAAVFLGAMTVYSIGVRTSVVGTSMEPVLFNGEEVLLNRMIYQFSTPRRGDIIAFHPNGDENTHLYVKRVIGLPGETVQIKQGAVYINGEKSTTDDIETLDAGVAKEPMKLSDEEYFVMGDNRENSEDSRSANIGNVTREMIEGKVWYHMTYDNIRMGKVE